MDVVPITLNSLVTQSDLFVTAKVLNVGAPRWNSPDGCQWQRTRSDQISASIFREVVVELIDVHDDTKGGLAPGARLTLLLAGSGEPGPSEEEFFRDVPDAGLRSGVWTEGATTLFLAKRAETAKMLSDGTRLPGAVILGRRGQWILEGADQGLNHEPGWTSTVPRLVERVRQERAAPNRIVPKPEAAAKDVHRYP